jgi:subtilisin family serine protease
VKRIQEGFKEITQTRNKFNKEISQINTATQTSKTNGDVLNYGNSLAQIRIHEGEFLHNKGFKGEGMLLAIFDGGFRNYLTLTAFDSARNNNQIVETYDFVQNETSVNEDDPHGMYCFSIIAANWPGQLVGSCTKAKYYLYRTEDVATEFPIEEQNWAAAAERADSIGVDVFSTSLGYSTFDNPVFNHTYADMNGKTTIIARANSMAARKGIISVVAAGNDGNNAWHFIATPADADSIVTTGAVNTSGVVASFSSYGPSSDGRVKPTVASVGQGTAIAGLNNLPTFGNGTSFATPNLAGLITCLWQAFPGFTNMQIIEAVKRSSSIYTTPNDRIGYGIPNFHKAYDDLFKQRALLQVNTILGNDWIKAYPNPFKQSFTLLMKPKNTGTTTFKLFDTKGNLFLTKQVSTLQGQAQFITLDNLQPLAKGIYILHYANVLEKGNIRIAAQ